VVLGSVVDRAVQYKSQGVAAAVAVADIRTDPGRDSAGEEAVPVVGQEEGAPASSFVPCLGSACPGLG
jgi:hypothetical protein